MKLIRHLTWRNMRQSRSRTLVTVLGIILSAAMFTAVTTMGVSLHSYLLRTEVANSGDFFIQYNYGTMEDLELLQQEEAVSKLGTVKTLGYTTFSRDSEYGQQEETLIVGAGNPEFFEMVPLHLEDGRLPQNDSEIIITRNVYEFLKNSGLPCEIGASLHLNIAVSYEDDDFDLPSFGTPYEKNYTIVGITDYVQYFDDNMLNLSSILTVDNGSQPALWGRFFVKTDPASAAYDLEEQAYGSTWSVNQDLLELYGVSKYASVNDLIISFAMILIVIILVGSVSLIYNAFSISVSERTKQFGLLSSVGATKKQIRKCVFTEALYLSAAGIPLGIFCGYVGIAVTLHLTHGLIDDLLLGAAENGIYIKAVPSFPAFAVAGVVALVTVVISAWIPAHRATKITPISAIRQTEEYQIPKRGIRAGKFSQKLFGVPAALARKYYTVNKRKYRATIISLTISIVLFVSASCFVQQLNLTAEEQANTDNFDFDISVKSQEQIDKLRSHPALKDSSLVFHDEAQAVIPEEAFTDGYRKAWQSMTEFYHYDTPISSKRVRIEYLEDDILRTFLTNQGIDPVPYLNADNPKALVTTTQFNIYRFKDNGRPEDRERLTEQILKDSIESITLMPSYLPDGVIQRLGESVFPQGASVVDGTMIQSVMIQKESEDGTLEDLYFQFEVRPMEDGKHFGYYFLDPESGKPEAEPTDIVSMDRSQLAIGESIRQLPMGVRQNVDSDFITVILPLSAANFDQEYVSLMATTSDYNAFLDFLKEEDFPYVDYLDSQMQYRDYITMIRVFSYGFIILISLICICNVFNTISTNIALRRKDFGMLRSIGMKDREINRMMAFECMQYGLKSMLWGVPLSIVASYAISRVGETSFEFPVGALVIAAGCIFLTVFITMFYAVSKLKKQNPIEAIRCES